MEVGSLVAALGVAGGKGVDEAVCERAVPVAYIAVGRRGRIEHRRAGQQVARDGEVLAGPVAERGPTLLAGEREGVVGVDTVELSLRAAVVGVQEPIESVLDPESVGEVLDAFPPEVDVDDTLCGDCTVLARKRTQPADACEPGRHRNPVPGLFVAVLALVLFANADAEGHESRDVPRRQKCTWGPHRGSVSEAGRDASPAVPHPIARPHVDIELVGAANPVDVLLQALCLPECLDGAVGLAQFLVGEHRVDLVVAGATEHHRWTLGTALRPEVVFLDGLWVVDALVGNPTPAQFAGRRHHRPLGASQVERGGSDGVRPPARAPAVSLNGSSPNRSPCILTALQPG